MTEETIIHLMRHGETDSNLHRRWQGSQDVPLNTTGRKQAEEAAWYFADLPLAAIYSSHLKRAFETGLIIGKRKNLFPTTYPELAEQCFGSLEGKLIEETVELYREKFILNETLTHEEQFHFRIVEDMETTHGVLQRSLPILKHIASQHPGEEILIISHGNVIKSLLMLLTSERWQSFKIENCKWHSFVYRSKNQHFDFVR